MNNFTQNLLDELKTLLSDGIVNTQEDICHALVTKGYDVNQSKISRLLRKMGAVKARNEYGDVAYRLPKEPAPPTLNSQLISLIFDVSHNEQCILIHTSPGSASMIARLLDHHRERAGILGCIA